MKASVRCARSSIGKEGPVTDGPNIECLDEWAAWYDRMPGRNDPNLHVTGKIRCFSGSIQLRLEPGNEGVVEQPELFVLELKVDEPTGGTTDVVDKPVDWSDDVGQGIRVVRIQGPCSATIDVIIANGNGFTGG
jgi:hypothetical protein